METHRITPSRIKELCENISLDQTVLARGLSIPSATWYRYMKSPDGSGIPEEVNNMLLAFESVVNDRKKSGLNDNEIKHAVMTTGVAGVVARAAMAGILPQSLLGALALNPFTSWIGAVVPFVGAGVGGIAAISGLSLFSKLKPKTQK